MIQTKGSLYAQENNQPTYSIHQSQSTIQGLKNYYVVERPEKSVESTSSDVRVIVRFKGSPLSNSDKTQKASASASIESVHQQFLSDLKNLDTNPAMRKATSSSKILFDYREVFNGYALVTSQGIVEEIKKLPYISYVVEDKEIQISDIPSNEVIKAPKVWSKLELTGKGITIGIMDTGIDYNHPDLGGGFGPDFKVNGGYDFVNKDDDPIDDHGHGTHVAGIAAANGSELKGVAPDANLVAYKVLSAGGYGLDSWILAAIERSVDPDQNPDTDDALDVVNMSLGRSPDSTEPLSEAVNNAVARGVVYVISAGNSHSILTIGTPGIAERAITVGATDNYDATAYFSSKGPVKKTFALKPDLAAPGVDIYSTYTNGEYRTFSGTSMASPHVAGAVALILEQNPEWDPDMVKAALMNTAKKSHDIIWSQGAGRMDIYEALKGDFIVTPGSISLGGPSVAATEKTITATVYNLSNTAKNFDLSIEGTIVNPSVLTFISTPSFSLAAHSSQDVEITFSINPSTLPVMNLPDGITGNLVVSSDGRTIKSPITLVNPQKTKIEYDGEVPENVFVFGTDGNSLWNIYYPTSTPLELFLPTGRYDMISHFSGNHTVVTEGFFADENKTISISKSLAKNRIVFRPLDQNGNVIPITNETNGLAIFTGINKNFVTYYAYAEDTFFISDQQAYRYDISISGSSPSDPEHYYHVSASTNNGITQSETVSNNPSRFAKLNIYNPGAETNQGFMPYQRAGTKYGYITSWNNYDTPVPNPLRLLLSANDENCKILGSFARISPLYNESGYSWETPAWKASSNNKLVLEDKNFNTIKHFDRSSFDFKLGSTLLGFTTKTANTAENIIISDSWQTGNFNHFYGDREYGTVYYKLFSKEKLIKEGNFGNSANMIGGTHQIPAVQQSYKMFFTYEDYQVQGKFGKATAETEFNTSLNDKDAPQISYLNLLVKGKSVNHYQVGEQATIVVKVQDLCSDQTTWEECSSVGLSTVDMYLKKHGSTEWEPLTISETMYGEYHASLSKSLSEGYYSYKIIAKDFSNNSLTYELKPAFLIGEGEESTPFTKVNLLYPANRSINEGTNPTFLWSSLPSADYIFQLSETESFDSPLMEVEGTDVTYSLSQALEANKNYYWRVKAHSQGKKYPWSTVYSFYSGTLSSTSLLYPEQDANVEELAVQFKWSNVEGASSYLFELSLKEDFSDYQEYRYLDDTSLLIENILPDTEYFWRVTTFYNTSDNQYVIPSAIHRFSTFEETETPVDKPLPPKDETVTVIDQAEKKQAYNFPNPFSSSTSIEFYIDKPEEVSLSILDPLGREVKYFKEKFDIGKNSILWNGSDKENVLLPNGMYYGILKTSREAIVIKMLFKR